MIKGKGIYLALSVLALALTGLGIVGYVDLNRKYAQLDKKFTATADSLKDYKVTLQNQGLYGPLNARVDSLNGEITNLKGFTEAFFGGSELTNEEFAGKIGKLEERIESSKWKKQTKKLSDEEELKEIEKRAIEANFF